MSEPLRNAAPVGATGGFPERAGPYAPRRPDPDASGPRPESGDLVHVSNSAAIARRLLRERVLARTWAALGLEAGTAGPEFAEVIDAETPAELLSRLLGAQNQIAARRAGQWRPDQVRAALDQALRFGCAETTELLAGDAAAVALIAAVLQGYAQRLAALAAGPGDCR